jgi:hypothetical protein
MSQLAQEICMGIVFSWYMKISHPARQLSSYFPDNLHLTNKVFITWGTAFVKEINYQPTIPNYM